MPNYSHGTKLALAAADEPPYLTVGTDVSAKYKGAFCEAKIIDVNKNVKVRVLFDGSSGNHLIDDTELKAGSTLEVGAKVEAKHPEKKQQTYIAATITKILDHSRYTVVFDDGDQCILRRSSICLKSGKHFAESETLDQLPLTNPEHFGNPVKVGQATAEQSSNQQNSNHNHNNNNNNNINSNRNNQQAQNDKQSSSTLKNGNNDTVGGKSSSNKIVNPENNPTPTNGRAAATQNNVKLETTDKPTSKTKTASANSATTNAVLSTPGRRGGKGRKARDSLASNSKLTEMADDPGDSSLDSAEADNGDPSVNNLIEVGVKLMVQYGKGKIQNVYEAKVNKIETNSAGKTRYFVHYTGWNNRYDEWVTKNRILSIVTDKENGVRDGRSRQSEAANSTASLAAASSNSTAKEINSVKEKDVSTPAKGPRRSRLAEASATASVPASSSTTASTNTTVTITTAPQVALPTPVATPAKDRDKIKDKSRDTPAKTRRSRHIVDSSANSAATSSSASSTSSVASAAAPTAIKDEPKEKEAAPASIAAPSKPGRPRQSEARESISNSNPSSTNFTKDKDKEPPTKTRRSKLVEATVSNSTLAASNGAEVLSSPPGLMNNQTERDKTRDSAKDTQRPATKEDRSEKQQQSELAPAVNSKTTTQINQSTNSATKDRDTEKEPSSVQPTKSRGSRQSESSHASASINPALSTTSTSSSASSTTSSTTTTIATVTQTMAASTAITSITSTATTPCLSTSSAGAASVAPHPSRDRERDKEREKEPPTKIRRSRQTTTETSEKTTSNVTTSATISTTATSSTSSASAQVANPSTASSVSSSSSSSSSITFSNNVMSAYNLIEKERFSDLPIIDEPDCDKRISILQDKIMAIKQTYLALRSELVDLDRRKKRPRLERSNSDHINFSGVTCRN